MAITRRALLGALGAAGASAVLPWRTRGREVKGAASNAVAVLYDPTRCIGCEQCIRACAEENGGDADLATGEAAALTPLSLTVLRRYELGALETFRKVQCMHCVDPGCVSGCMLGAMAKDGDGAVVWNPDLCVGCRYCEIACPFNVPRFQWDTPTPELKKCQMCPSRRAKGLEPACVAACRRGALTFGTRVEMLAEAHRRIAADPARYNPRVYGEQDAGGTSMLYLAKAGVSFAEMGLPELGTTAVASLPEMVQHTLYKGFALPLGLFAGLAGVVRRNTRLQRDGAAPEHGRSAPVGGRLLTWPFAALLTLAAIGVATILWRFVVGLGATTHLNDGYPFGLWITFDVVTGTALACGGYAVALLVYVANRGRYHPLVRAAIVTSALGYTLGGLSVLIDIGRGWNFYKIPLMMWQWNLNSILLEVALCITLYTCVLWIELSPAFLERWQEGGAGVLRRFSAKALPKVERAMPYLIALGMVLPTMHQSSLGSLMMLSGQKLHPLWQTPLLPLLFLVSCLGMGYAAVTLECCISSRVFHRPKETPMLRSLAAPVATVLFSWVIIRVFDVVHRGQLDLVTRMDGYSLLFLLELVLFTVPAAVLVFRRRVARDGRFAFAAALVITAGALYRFSTYLLAYDPGGTWTYFPALPEFAVTVGLVAAELAGYVFLVKRFPVLRGGPPVADRGVEEPKPTGDRVALKLASTVGVVVVLLLAGSPVGAQDVGHIDRRCLTNRPQDCLAVPVPKDEPHGAECSTCHNLWSQRSLKEAVRSCTRSGCHEDARAEAPFHRTVAPAVLADCIDCHDPHNARLVGGSSNCKLCHAGGGRLPSFVPAGDVPPLPPLDITDARFRHQYHVGRACTDCHRSDGDHRTLKVTGVVECRACHHTARSGEACTTCHQRDRVDRMFTLVTTRLDIRIGSLDRPERMLPFEHRVHVGAGCATCHTGGTSLEVSPTRCNGCHEDHHRPDTDCRICHAAPAAGAHDRSVHLRPCGDAGCHEEAPAGIRDAPRTRSVCLACHQTLADHQPGRNCVDCHLLPAVRAGGR